MSNDQNAAQAQENAPGKAPPAPIVQGAGAKVIRAPGGYETERRIPRFRLEAEGKDVTQIIADRLISIKVSDKAGIMCDELALTIDDRDALVMLPADGAKLETWLGYEGDKGTVLINMGTYYTDEATITGGSRQISIKAKSAIMDTLKSYRKRDYKETNAKQIIEQIASENGLTAEVDKRYAEPKIKHLAQNNESDMNLLTRLAKEHGAIMAIKSDKLIFKDRASGIATDGDDMPVHRLAEHEVSGWSVTLAKRALYRAVIVYWQDKKDGQKEKTVVAYFKDNKQGGENGQAASGAEDIAFASLTRRDDDTNAIPAEVGEPIWREKNPAQSQEDAEKLAKSKLEELQRDTSKLDLTLPGRPEIGAESVLTLSGFRAEADGEWVVESAEHALSNAGLSTHLTATRKT